MAQRMILDKDAVLSEMGEQLGHINVKIHTEEAEWRRHEISLDRLIGILQARRSKLKVESEMNLNLLRSQRRDLEGKLRDLSQF